MQSCARACCRLCTRSSLIPSLCAPPLPLAQFENPNAAPLPFEASSLKDLTSPYCLLQVKNNSNNKQLAGPNARELHSIIADSFPDVIEMVSVSAQEKPVSDIHRPIAALHEVSGARGEG